MSPLELAERAHSRVKICADLEQTDPKRKRFRTLAMNAPALIRQAGAVQAVAFWRRNGDGKTFSDALANVLDKQDGKALVDWLVGLEPNQYTSASRAMVRAATWVRRFTQSDLCDD